MADLDWTVLSAICRIQIHGRYQNKSEDVISFSSINHTCLYIENPEVLNKFKRTSDTLNL